MPTATLANLGSKPGLSAADQRIYDELWFGEDAPTAGFEPWLMEPDNPKYMKYWPSWKRDHYMKTGEIINTPPVPEMSPRVPKESGFVVPWWGWALGAAGVLAIWRPWK